MVHLCYRRGDEFPVRPYYTIRLIGGRENLTEIKEWLSLQKYATNIDCSETYHYIAFKDCARSVLLSHGEFLVMTDTGHFRTYTEGNFFKEFFIS